MIKPGPILLKTHLKGLFEELDKSDALIEAQREFQKAAIDASAENHGTDPAAIRQMKARRKKMAKDPAQVSRSDELYDHYKFMMEGGISPPVVPSPSDELSRVMALTNTAKPPKIEAIRKALGCSQGKAHKLRSQAAARLATKSSSSSVLREHEHLPARDPATGEIEGDAPNVARDGEASAERDASASSSPPESCGGRGVGDSPAPHGLAPEEKGPGTPDNASSLLIEAGQRCETVGNVAIPETPSDRMPLSSPPQDIDLTIPPFLRRAPATVQP